MKCLRISLKSYRKHLKTTTYTKFIQILLVFIWHSDFQSTIYNFPRDLQNPTAQLIPPGHWCSSKVVDTGSTVCSSTLPQRLGWARHVPCSEFLGRRNDGSNKFNTSRQSNYIIYIYPKYLRLGYPDFRLKISCPYFQWIIISVLIWGLNPPCSDTFFFLV